MSEYQYYEFLAIDRPLTVEETAALPTISTGDSDDAGQLGAGTVNLNRRNM